jgi:hypothetical protein
MGPPHLLKTPHQDIIGGIKKHHLHIGIFGQSKYRIPGLAEPCASAHVYHGGQLGHGRFGLPG